MVVLFVLQCSDAVWYSASDCRAPGPADGQRAATGASASSRQATGQNQEPDPLKRERSDKEKFAAQKAVKQELKGAYKTWLNQDVAWIIYRRRTQSLQDPEQR